ncbi:GDP-mannose-dependent alpha-(1-6)-phosphatidylinositol monomannoside mannosyltransferase [bacterium HR15]|nr:GDP-mannose-dependent alpha-(1-6)-phosphatidylinositol monomannoside mannosyltransferase [bacterium HR15]
MNRQPNADMERGTGERFCPSERWQRLWQRLPNAFTTTSCLLRERGLDAGLPVEPTVHFAKQLPDGSAFLVAHSGMPDSPERWRESLETELNSTVHLLDPEPEADWLMAFGWKGQQVPRIKWRVRMIPHRRALQMMGGGETQLLETLYALRQFGVVADVSIALRLPETNYALNHLFSLYHADRLEQLERCQKPFVASPIFWDYTELLQAGLIIKAIFSQTDAHAVQRMLDAWRTRQMALPQVPPLDTSPLRRVLQLARVLMPNAQREHEALKRVFGVKEQHVVLVPNAIRPEQFLKANPAPFVERHGLRDFVLCAARIEPNKNQLMLIWALRETGLPLVLAGKEGDSEYAALCRRWAGTKVHFVGELSPEMLASAYAAARVHALPSWSETPGLVNLEAALVGCSLVVGNRGAEQEYLGEWAHVCDPGDVRSIHEAVRQAWDDTDPARREARRQHVLHHYTWQQAAERTAYAYELALAMPDRWLLLPDWNQPQTWLPALQCHLTQQSRATLLLYAGSLNGANPAEAYEQVLNALHQLGVDDETCPDIELTDHLPTGDVRPLLTGGGCDLLLQVQYGARCQPLQQWLNRG